MQKANDSLNELAPLVKLSKDIAESTEAAVGAAQGLATTLAAAPPDARRLIRSMRLFVDGSAQRQLTSTSLGALNVLYFSLLELRLKYSARRTTEGLSKTEIIRCLKRFVARELYNALQPVNPPKDPADAA
jgi:hypothetical protein